MPRTKITSKKDELLNRAMALLRPAAKKAGMSQEEYLVQVLEGKIKVSRSKTWRD